MKNHIAMVCDRVDDLLGVGRDAIMGKYHLIHARVYWIKALREGSESTIQAITFTPLSAYAYIFLQGMKLLSKM
jgi:hypothetical protein